MSCSTYIICQKGFQTVPMMFSRQMRENPELFRPENTKNYKFTQASLLSALKAEIGTKVIQDQDTKEMVSKSKFIESCCHNLI